MRTHNYTPRGTFLNVTVFYLSWSMPHCSRLTSHRRWATVQQGVASRPSTARRFRHSAANPDRVTTVPSHGVQISDHATFFANGDHPMSTSTQRADLDPTCGTGRFMACRPVGLRAPKRVDLRWMMRRSTSCSRVSAMRPRTSPNSRTGSREYRYSG
jgi:hypothetical protein